MLLAYLPEDQVLHQDFRGRIPLHYAIENAEAVEMVKILLKYIPDQQVLAAKQKRDEAPLHVACKHGQAEVVRTLLAFRPTEQVLLEDDNLFLPLQRACERHYSEITALLLEHIPHEQLRSQDHFNNLLSVACSHPFGREGDPTGVVRQLLSLREYELSGEPKERLPIHIASRNGYADVVAM